MAKQNIIFILSDQQRHDSMGCYGQELEVTPNLDNFAKNGVIFTHAFTCQPVCGPARSCIQTGLYATETGCFRNGIPLPISDKNIANYFSSNGYEVGYIGKWHLASYVNVNIFKRSKEQQYINRGVTPELRGGYKDYWLASDLLEFTSHGYDGYLFDKNMKKVEFEGYRVDCLTDFVLEYLETRDGKKPFFLFISYLEPHHQNDHNQFEGPIGSKEKFKDYKIPGDLEDTKGDWRENYPDYLGCCNSIDKNFGRIYNKLNEVGVLENTLIIYTSDHGCHFRTRNSEYKRSAHEASVHIPLIINGPKFQGGKKITELVSLIDLPPTLLTAGGIDVPKHMKGRSLHSLVNGTPKDWPQEIFIQISESQIGRAIRTKRWKYSVKAKSRRGFYDSSAKEYEEELLYDLENDIYEKNNLIKDPNYSELRVKLANILKKKMVEADEEVPKIKPL